MGVPAGKEQKLLDYNICIQVSAYQETQASSVAVQVETPLGLGEERGEELVDGPKGFRTNLKCRLSK